MAINTFIFELTNKCNEHCNFCYSLSYQPKGVPQRGINQLSTEDWIRSLENIVFAGAKAVDLGGGEPTLHSGFAQILSYAKSKSLQTVVSTNCSTYENTQIRDALANYADCISISLHGVNSTIHDKIKKRQGSYDLALKSIIYYLTKTQVKVNSVACQDNLRTIADIGNVLAIEDNDLMWKVSKALLEGAGAYNRSAVEISDADFDSLERIIRLKYPRAVQQRRVVFRRPSNSVEPYIIVRSDGSLHIPKGEGSIDLGVYITNNDFHKELDNRIKLATDAVDEFKDRLKKNHFESYFMLDANG